MRSSGELSPDAPTSSPAKAITAACLDATWDTLGIQELTGCSTGEGLRWPDSLIPGPWELGFLVLSLGDSFSAGLVGPLGG